MHAVPTRIGPPATVSLSSVVGESTCVVETREKRVTEAAYSHAEQVNESLAHARADRVQCHGIGLKVRLSLHYLIEYLKIWYSSREYITRI